MAPYTLSKLFRRWAFNPRNIGRKTPGFPLTLETVEDRLAPATLPPATLQVPTGPVAQVAIPRNNNTPVDFINPQVVADPTNQAFQVMVATSVTQAPPWVSSFVRPSTAA